MSNVSTHSDFVVVSIMKTFNSSDLYRGATIYYQKAPPYEENTISFLANSEIAAEDVDSLERIELQENQIESIPNIIGNLSRLKYITIQKNNITTIPARIGELEQLEVFKIYDNELVEVHENIGQLLKLISLNLSYNQLENLPESMCNILSNPEIQISIDNNKICNGYPDCFISLVNNADQPACSQ